MTALEYLRRLWEHSVWADDKLLSGIQQRGTPPAAIREYAHILGADEVWLSRLEGRAPSLSVWPELAPDAAAIMARDVHAKFSRYLQALRDDDLTRPIAYTNTAGRAFVTPVGEILTHVMLHGQYHRGKVNLLLRQSGAEPAPADYIAFVRGVPAARAKAPQSS